MTKDGRVLKKHMKLRKAIVEYEAQIETHMAHRVDGKAPKLTLNNLSIAKGKLAALELEYPWLVEVTR